jgi:hypothetical protein
MALDWKSFTLDQWSGFELDQWDTFLLAPVGDVTAEGWYVAADDYFAAGAKAQELFEAGSKAQTIGA